MRRRRTYDRLMRLECFAYDRWRRGRSPLWYALAVACNGAVKGHPDYGGVR